MKRFFFDLIGEFPAHDFLGINAFPKRNKGTRPVHRHRIGTEKPSFAKTGNYILVRDEKGAEIYEAPIQANYVTSLP